jgi:hypothetical protein
MLGNFTLLGASAVENSFSNTREFRIKIILCALMD